MLSAIRAFAKSWVAIVLFALLIVSFVIWGGARDVFHGKISTYVVTAGAHHMGADEFKRVFNNELQRLEQERQGQTISLQDAVAGGFDTHVLSDAATQEAYSEFVDRLGLRASNEQVLQAITQIPVFSAHGAFDRQTYLSVLSDNKLTPEVFEADERDEIAQRHLDPALNAAASAPRTYSAMIAAFELESRDLSFIVLDPQTAPAPAPPTDAQLQALLNQHAEQLRRPEMRLLSVVRLSAKALSATTPIDPAALQKLYAFRKDTAATPEQRSLVEIPVKDPATAAAVAAKLRAGQDPAAVAKAIGAQPIVYANAPKTAIADSKIANAAFSMPAGAVSDPIKGDLGLGVIKMGEIKPPHTPTLDEMRPQLEAQARADTAAAKVYQMAQKYTDAHGGGANMTGSATAAGVSVQSVGPVSAGGVDMTRRPAPGLTPKLLADAFKLPAGAETDMENEGPGEYFAVRVDKVLPPAVPSLAELKPMLAQFYMSTEMEKALKAKADELAARIRKGESIDAVAASAGAKVGHATGVSRFSLARNQSIGEQMAAQIFNAKKGDVFDGPTGQRSPSGLTAFMVARIDALSPPASAQAAAMTAQRASALSEGMFEDIVVLLRDEAKAKIKPKIDADLARQALGLSPDSLPKTPDVKPAGTRAQ